MAYTSDFLLIKNWGGGGAKDSDRCFLNNRLLFLLFFLSFFENLREQQGFLGEVI